MKPHQRGIAAIARWMTIVVFPLVLLLFFPLTEDFFDFPKWIVLVVFTGVILLLWGLHFALTNHTRLWTPRALWGVLAMGAALILSLVISSPNRIEALVSPLGIGTLGAMGLLIALAGPFVGHTKDKAALRWIFISSSVVAAVAATYQSFGLSASMFPDAPYLTDPLWTPVGSPTGLLILLLVSLPLVVEELIAGIRSRNDYRAVAAGVMGILITIGLVVVVGNLTPRFTRHVLPISAGWTVTMEALKSAPALLSGVGMENYLGAFTAGRPVWLNQTASWNLRYPVSSTTALHYVTTLGLAGAVALVLLLWGLVPRRLDGLGIGKLVLVAALVLLPPSFALWAIVSVCILLSDDDQYVTIHLHASDAWVSLSAALLSVLVAVGAGYGVARVTRGERAFFRSLMALQNRDGTAAYNSQIAALTASPWTTRFHVAYSQTNIALAQALAAQSRAASPSAQPSPSDTRQLIAQLVQQAIREAKLAATMSPKSIIAWENLARTYQSIADAAQGADQWTIAAYQRAIQMDSTNPLLRIELGSQYVRQNRFDLGIQQFLAAATLKSDLANVYYNLANAYRLSGNTTEAIRALEQTLRYLSPDSNDYVKAQNELVELTRKKPPSASIPQGTDTGAQTLTKPAFPTPLISPKLELPADASPPASAR